MGQNDPTFPSFEYGSENNSSTATSRPASSGSQLGSESDDESVYQKYITGKPKRIIIRARISHDND